MAARDDWEEIAIIFVTGWRPTGQHSRKPKKGNGKIKTTTKFIKTILFMSDTTELPKRKERSGLLLCGKRK